MITREILVANAALAGLTEDQINAIITISTNDTNAEVGSQLGSVYRRLDEAIKNGTGIERNGAEKTYDYLPRAISAMKESLGDTTSLKAQIDTLTAEKTRLEGEIAKGGSAELQRQLDQTKAELANTKTQYNEIQAQLTKAQADHQTEIFGMRVENELSVAAKGITFKPEIPASVTSILLKNATDKIKGMNPDYIDNGVGGKVLVFRDATGAIRNNRNNQLNPYTAEELLLEELADVIAAKRTVTGSGTKPDPYTGGTGTFDLTGAKTRTEAHEILTKALMEQGMVQGSDEFETAMSKAWAENEISKLPLK